MYTFVNTFKNGLLATSYIYTFALLNNGLVLESIAPFIATVIKPERIPIMAITTNSSRRVQETNANTLKQKTAEAVLSIN